MIFFIPYGTREDQPRRRLPWVTISLVAVNIAVFAYQLYLLLVFGDIASESFYAAYAAVPADVNDGTPFELSLITSMFLHGGIMHIVGNMIYLMPFGDNVEDRLGPLLYLIFYLLCGLAAVLVYIVFNPYSSIHLVGASGAIAGVLGGYLALHFKGMVKGLLVIVVFFMRVELPAIFFIGYWFVVQLFSSVQSFGGTLSEGDNVAYVAHVGGFVAGLVLAPLLGLLRPRNEANNQI